jgi:hypothetical protein
MTYRQAQNRLCRVGTRSESVTVWQAGLAGCDGRMENSTNWLLIRQAFLKKFFDLGFIRRDAG